jgi:hypothetical protein
MPSFLSRRYRSIYKIYSIRKSEGEVSEGSGIVPVCTSAVAIIVNPSQASMPFLIVQCISIPCAHQTVFTRISCSWRKGQNHSFNAQMLRRCLLWLTEKSTFSAYAAQKG